MANYDSVEPQDEDEHNRQEPTYGGPLHTQRFLSNVRNPDGLPHSQSSGRVRSYSFGREPNEYANNQGAPGGVVRRPTPYPQGQERLTAPPSYMSQEPSKHEKSMDTNQEVQQEEPVGAQVLRRLHSDGNTLLQEYDEMMGLLDHPDVKDHLHSHLRGLDKFLSGTEKLFGKHYKELSPLDDGIDEDEDGEEFEDEESKDEEFPLEEENGEPQEGEEQDPYQEEMAPDQVVAQEQEDLAPDDAVEADGDRPDPPSPEEALEGMQRADAEQYEPGEMGVKGQGSNWRDEQPPHIDQTVPKNSPRVHGTFRDPNIREGNTTGEGMYITRQRYQNRVRNDAREDRRYQEATQHSLDAEGNTVPSGYVRAAPQESSDNSPSTSARSEEHKSIFQDHEIGKLSEAHSFLQELSQSRDFGDLHRMKAYHFHKSLEPLGIVGTKAEYPPDTSPEFEMANGEPEPTTGEKGAGPNQPRPARIRFHPDYALVGTEANDPNNYSSVPGVHVSEDRDVPPVGGSGIIRARAQGRQTDYPYGRSVPGADRNLGGHPVHSARAQLRRDAQADQLLAEGHSPIGDGPRDVTNRRANRQGGVRTRPIKVEGIQPSPTQSTQPEQKGVKASYPLKTPRVPQGWDQVDGGYGPNGSEDIPMDLYTDVDNPVETDTEPPIDLTNLDEDKGLTSHPHRQSVAEVSNFFRDLCLEKAFGEPHREKALYYHKLLAPIFSSGQTGQKASYPGPKGDPGPEPNSLQPGDPNYIEVVDTTTPNEAMNSEHVQQSIEEEEQESRNHRHQDLGGRKRRGKSVETKGQGTNWRDKQDPHIDQTVPKTNAPPSRGTRGNPNVAKGGTNQSREATGDYGQARQNTSQHPPDSQRRGTLDTSRGPRELTPEEGVYKRKSLDEVVVDQAVTIAELTKTLQSITEQLG